MQEKPGYAKAMLGAGLVGGVSGVVGAALVVLFSFTPLYEQGLSVFMALAVLGVLGAVLFFFNIYPKIETFGGIGAKLPFTGLCSAFADKAYEVGKATGSGAKGARAVLIDLFLKVLLFGTALSCIVGAVVFSTGFGMEFTAPYAPGGVIVESLGPPHGTADGPSMGVPVGIDWLILLWAFLAAGFVCALAQLILMLSGLHFTKLVVILFFLSAIITPFGVMYFAGSFAGGGLQILVFGAGEAVTSTFAGLLNGNFAPFVLVLGLFAFLYIMGVGTGLLKLALEKP